MNLPATLVTLPEALQLSLGLEVEEEAEFWFRYQRRLYDDWWTFEEHLNELLGIYPESTEAIERLRRVQIQIHGYQRDVGRIRDRLCDYAEGE
jgi:hypothetical protein